MSRHNGGASEISMEKKANPAPLIRKLICFLYPPLGHETALACLLTGNSTIERSCLRLKLNCDCTNALLADYIVVYFATRFFAKVWLPFIISRDSECVVPSVCKKQFYRVISNRSLQYNVLIFNIFFIILQKTLFFVIYETFFTKKKLFFVI